ncbi:hypothetical protein GOBAR_AA07312 [Gossypium barbadense]|uniref:Leucine-rich repeat-containing N-terminal plant-type domain-containing protein n=1 Tax=Gossypium barbadense TaxID=3634 RepID=A0A2P5YCM8_GOSBA|nr:hypothetical protein GOBAR_AA07312 [Gossypium barbadense]
MALFLTISLILGILQATILLISFDTTVSIADPSPLESKAISLLESGWWSNHSSNTSQRCQCPAITCNTAESITKIDLSDAPNIEVAYRFGNQNQQNKTTLRLRPTLLNELQFCTPFCFPYCIRNVRITIYEPEP